MIRDWWSVRSKHLGAKNVTCYSYGPRGNFEGKIAKKISERLGFDWVFVQGNTEDSTKILENPGTRRICKSVK